MQIATFNLIDTKSIPGLLAKAVVRKTWLGKTKDEFWDFLSKNSQKLQAPDLSGTYLAVLLALLDQNGINLMDSDLKAEANQLSEARGSTVFIFTTHQKGLIQKVRSLEWRELELRKQFEEFNEDVDPESGKAMLNWIEALMNLLEKATDSKVIILQIG